MIERLQKAMQQIDEIPSELQDQIAELIESAAPSSISRRADHFFGIWNDLDAVDMLDELDRMQHEVPPTPLSDEQLSWLDEDGGE